MTKEDDGKVLSDDDVQFLDGVTGKPMFTNEEDEVEEEETAEEEEVDGKEEKEDVVVESITKEDVAAIEQKLGRKLTEDELTELKEKAKSGEEEISEDFTLIDPNKLPKEIQPHFKRMFAFFHQEDARYS